MVAVALAASANTLLNGFVYDDHVNILGNPWVRNPSELWRAFAGHVAAFDPNANSSFYRPMMHVIYAGTHGLFGLRSWGFHAVNLVVHGMASLCVYILLRRSCDRACDHRKKEAADHRLPGLGAVIGAALFAAHPIHTEAVAWLAGITDLSYGLFVLVALLLATDPGSTPVQRMIVAPLSFFIAMLCKEPAVVLLPVLGVAWATDGGWSGPRRRRDLAVRFVPYLIASGCYFLLRWWALGGFAGSDRRVEAGPWESVATGIALLGAYIGKLLAPAHLAAMYDFPIVESARDLRLWVGLGAIAAIAWIVARFHRIPGVNLGAALLVFPLLPATFLPALGEGLFAERYLYLPSVGGALLLALGIDSLKRRPVAYRMAIGLSTAAILVSAWATFERNEVWRTDLSLWQDTASRVPSRAGAQEALGTALYFAGRSEEAVVALTHATQLEPRLTDARVNLAASLCSLGRVDEALGQIALALEQRPDHPEGLSVLGWALLAQGRTAEGIAAYERALAVKPMQASTHNALGMAYARTGNRILAERHIREALRLDPSNPNYQRNLDLVIR